MRAELHQKQNRLLHRFFARYFKKLAVDMQMVVSKQVESSLRQIALIDGAEHIDAFFESDLAVVFGREDGKGLGDLHMLFGIRSAIAFSGLMMMMGPTAMAEMIQARAFDDTLQEAFHEIGNMALGALNSLSEKEIEGGHLVLDDTAYVNDMERPEAVGADTYVDVVAEITVEGFEAETFHILISPGLAEAIGGVSLAPSEENPDGTATPPQPIPGAAAGGTGPAAPPSAPQGNGDLISLMVDPASSAKDTDTVSQAIAAMKRDDAGQVGVLSNGVLIRVISRSDLRQLMGPFYGTNGMSAKDRAILNLQMGKICKTQQLVSIPVNRSVKEAVELVIENDLRSLPVVDENGALLGFIPNRELLRLLHGFLH